MKSKYTLFFALNILASLAIILLLIWFALSYLKKYTNHGTFIEVPDIKGMNIGDVEHFLKERNLLFEISDSIFENKYPKGTVVEQNPLPKSKVKSNRKIYLTVNALTQKMVALPELTDVSYSQAEATLKSRGLKVGNTIFEPSDCDQCVIKVQVNGKNISTNTMIPFGTKVDLVLGQTGSGDWIEVPELIGLNSKQVDEKINALLLNKYIVTMEGCNTFSDSLESIVIKQIPNSQTSKIKQGSTISIWMTCNE